MRKNIFCKVATLAAIALASGSVYAAGPVDNLVLGYFDASSALIPNMMSISLHEEIRFNDNIHNKPNSGKEGSLIFDTGLDANIYRTIGGVTYGLDADVSYEYYTKDSDDMSEFNWNISPYLNGELGFDFLRGLMVSLKSRSVYEPYSKTDTRSVRHYENGIGLAYDFTRGERWGLLATTQWMNYYYPQSKHDFSKSTYNEYEFGLAPYYKLSEKVKVGVHSTYTITRYTSSKKYDDSEKWKVNAFADYRLNMFFTVMAEAGVEQYNFHGVSKKSNKDRDVQPDFSLTFRYVPTIPWAFSYIVRYEPEYGSDSGRGLRTAFNQRLRASWQASSKINITNELGYDLDNEKNCNDDTGEFSYSLRANYAMNDRITLYAGYKFNDVHFKYKGDSDYHSNEYIVGLNWKLF